jgi:hypothetical protein
MSNMPKNMRVAKEESNRMALAILMEETNDYLKNNHIKILYIYIK